MKIALLTIYDVKSVDELYALIWQQYDKHIVVSVSTTQHDSKPASVVIEADVEMVFTVKPQEEGR